MGYYRFMVMLFMLSCINQAQAATVMINEVAFKETDGVEDWIELAIIGTGGRSIDIKNWSLDDLDGEKQSFATTTVTASVGEYIVVHDAPGIDETDTEGDINQNGYRDLYVGELNLWSTDDQVVLYDNGDAVVDAVCWANNNDTWSSNEQEDVNKVVALTQWKIAIGTSANESDCVSSKNIDDGNTIARYPNSQDTNSKDDWFVAVVGSPGRENPVLSSSQITLRINEVSFAEENSSDWVEFYCLNTDGMVEIGGYFLKGGSSKIVKLISPGTVIKKGEYLMLYQGSPDQDEKTAGSDNIITIFAEDTGLYSTDYQITLFDACSNVLDTVCWANNDITWSSSNISWVNELAELNQWQITGTSALQSDCVNSELVNSKESIARDANFTDTNTKDDWKIDPTPTPGKNNGLPTKSVRIQNLRLSHKCFLIDGSDPNRVATEIFFSLSNPSSVTIKIYDIRGRKIRTLVDSEERYSGDQRSSRWDGKNDNGKIVPIGQYIVCVEAVDSYGADSETIVVIVAKSLD